MDDTAKLLAIGINYPDSSCAATIDIASAIDLHAIGNARLRTIEVGKHMVGLTRQRSVRCHVKGANVATPRIVDVEHAFVGREGKAVRREEIVDQQRDGAEIGRDAV